MVKHFSHSHLTIICNFVEKFPALSKLHDEVKFGLKEETNQESHIINYLSKVIVTIVNRYRVSPKNGAML